MNADTPDYSDPEPPDQEEVRAVREDVASLLGAYARAVGVVDSVLHEHVRGVGTESGPVLARLALDRIRDGDRFRLLRVILRDIGSNAPVDSIDHVLRHAKPIRDDAAHSATWLVVADGNGVDDLSAALFRPISREARPPSYVTWRDLVRHRLRLDWATDWLQVVYLTDPAFNDAEERSTMLARGIEMPPREPPSMKR